MKVKTALLAIAAIAVIVLTGSVVIQAPQSREGVLLTPRGSEITYFAGRAQVDGPVARLTGGVTIKMDGTTVIADEAVVDTWVLNECG